MHKSSTKTKNILVKCTNNPKITSYGANSWNCLFIFSTIDSKFVDTPEELHHISRFKFMVRISDELYVCMSSYNNKSDDEIVKILYWYIKKVIAEKLENNLLSEMETITLKFDDYEGLGFDKLYTDRIPNINEAQFSVEIGSDVMKSTAKNQIKLRKKELVIESIDFDELVIKANEGSKKHVLFIGAGVSKDAGIHTTWELILELAKNLYAIEKGQAGSAETVEQWFLGSKYKNVGYAELIGKLFSSDLEQQKFLSKYLNQPPGEAHNLIAELARLGYVRAIVTTNFEECIEKALEEAGFKIEVISHVDDLRGVDALINLPADTIRIYKPNGTLGTGKLRNKPDDVLKLPPAFEKELVKDLSDHKVIVIGYKGNEQSIQRIFKGKNDRYPIFWVNRSEPCEGMISALQKSDAVFLKIERAREFLRDFIDKSLKIAKLTTERSIEHKLKIIVADPAQLAVNNNSGHPITFEFFPSFKNKSKESMEIYDLNVLIEKSEEHNFKKDIMFKLLDYSEPKKSPRDKNVIAREGPIIVPSGETVTLYVRTRLNSEHMERSFTDRYIAAQEGYSYIVTVLDDENKIIGQDKIIKKRKI